MDRGIHGEKIFSALYNEKLPSIDIDRLKIALQKYDDWIFKLNTVNGSNLDELIDKLVRLLNDYKMFIDIDLIFDSSEDFLYRQKGQLKLDNTVMEEFLPIYIKRCLQFSGYDLNGLNIGSQISTYSSMYFRSSISSPENGGGMSIKVKDQDFSMSRTVYIQSSYSSNFEEDNTISLTTHLGYVLAEIKTNLDKTMFQEGSATAHDVKQAVTGSKYYLLCDFLDMTPISTSTTDIDEILITRKGKRISSNIRSKFNTHKGRQENRSFYVKYLSDHPYSKDVLKRFLGHIMSLLDNETLVESNVLDVGYF